MTHRHPESNHDHQHAPKKGIHRDWRLWAAVALALGAMLAYVTSGDEAIRPAAPAGEQAPATAE
jgi:hypothetical protein